jgi:hypothetical protein
MVCDQITFTSHPRKDPLRAMATLRRVGGPWSRAWLISFFALFLFFSFFLISRSHHRLAFDNKTTYASQSQSFPLSQPHPFIFPFFYISRYTLLDNTADT